MRRWGKIGSRGFSGFETFAEGRKEVFSLII
jgi:predicted DNA-binding WGR domain protein